MLRRVLPWALLPLLASCEQLQQMEEQNVAGEAEGVPPGEISTGQPYLSAEDHLSFTPPAGWRIRREQGSIILVAPASSGRGASTIAIRSAAVEGDWVARRTPELVIPATRRAILALPGVSVSGERERDLGGLRGAEFELTFSPPRRAGRYERRHVVLVGDRQLFHVIHTGPAGSLRGTAVEFQKVVDSLKVEA